MMTRMLRSNGFADDHPVMTAALTPEQVADLLVKGIDAEKFLILSVPGGEQALVAKATDYDAWIAGAGAPLLRR
jgi:hypothetical protein